MNVHASTVRPGLCIGCGICDLACPTGAIGIRPDRYGENIPVIDEKTCIDCSECTKYCPNTTERIRTEAEKINNTSDPASFGISGRDGYIVFNGKEKDRIKSSSGGFTTTLLRHLKHIGRIDGVIHAERVMNPVGASHYRASLSKTLKEISEKCSSHYSSLSFSDAVRELRNKRGRYAMTGTPCVIRGYRSFLSSHPDYRHIEMLYIALTCSHNANPQFTDFLAESSGVGRGVDFLCNMRNKDGIPDADNFNIHFYTENGDLSKKNRFQSLFTKAWRNHYFSMNVCHYCSDFWGYEGDISVKDAWGKWAVDPLGKNIAVFRHPEMLDISGRIKDLVMKRIRFEELRDSQIGTAEYKQSRSMERIRGKKFSTANIRSGFAKYHTLSRITKWSYKKFGFRTSYFFTGIIQGIFDILIYHKKSLVKASGKMIRMSKKMIRLCLWPLLFFVRRFRTHRKNIPENGKKILVLGGYGYGNAGDEAQLSETIKTLNTHFPGYIIKVLTPDEAFTYSYHDRVNVGKAPRVAFFDAGSSGLYRLNSRIKKIRFLFRSFLIILNCHLLRSGLPSAFLKNDRVSLLQELKHSSLVYFSGGGYLTGRTVSRLWDGMVFIRASRIFHVPVFLSGQTIGVWGSKFNRSISKWGLSGATCITLRDPVFSMKDLGDIGIGEEKAFVTHDDALFCESVRNRTRILRLLKESGLDEEDLDNGFITFQFHFWNIDTLKERYALLDKIRSILDIHFKISGKKVVFLAMTPQDEKPIDMFMERFHYENVYRLRTAYDFRAIRGVISGSDLCMTMKHHPIIFAVGERIPVISLSMGDYYEHKNAGALKLFGLERMNVRIDGEDYTGNIRNLLLRLNRGENIYERIDEVFASLKEKRTAFIEKISNEISRT